jgi:Vacuolar protein sorting 55
MVRESVSQKVPFESNLISTVVDFGRFMTGFLVFSGLALPVVFAHNHMISIASMIMSLTGGSLVYLTIITFGAFFHEAEEF